MTFATTRSSDARQFEMKTELPQLIAFGSQLVHGSVGLNAAMPVYREHALNVLATPTTVLSVLPHYPSSHQVDVDPQWLVDVLNDVTLADAATGLQAIAVGYLADPGQARALADWFQAARETGHPPLILDPTMGDSDVGFYTDPAVATALRNHLAPLAEGLVPNRFELAHLVGTRPEELQDPAAVQEAAASLLSPITKWVVVTSAISGTEANQTGSAEIGNLIVTAEGSSLLTHSYISSTAKGAGDIFAASLNSYLVTGHDLAAAVNLAASDVQVHLRRA